MSTIAKPKATKFRAKQLSRVVDQRDAFLPDIRDKTSMAHGYSAVGDAIGLDPIVSGYKTKKSGGVYGHFFNDLSPGIKTLIMGKVGEIWESLPYSCLLL